jgi:hypothetical protein
METQSALRRPLRFFSARRRVVDARIANGPVRA